MTVYYLAASVVWYDRHERAWYAAPVSAFDTANANAGWGASTHQVVNRISGDLVRRLGAPPKGVSIERCSITGEWKIEARHSDGHLVRRRYAGYTRAQRLRAFRFDFMGVL
jgi:hypothetical protein